MSQLKTVFCLVQTPVSFCSFSFYKFNILQTKTVVFSRLRTRVIRVEGQRGGYADRYQDHHRESRSANCHPTKSREPVFFPQTVPPSRSDCTLLLRLNNSKSHGLTQKIASAVHRRAFYFTLFYLSIYLSLSLSLSLSLAMAVKVCVPNPQKCVLNLFA